MTKVAKVNDEVDELFQLPLPEFIEARNALAKRLKQNGQAGDADLVKTLAKPSVSAWTVNQLYWHHRDAFDQLLVAGRRFRQAQTSGKISDMRSSLDTRREALAHLSDLATETLREAGHNPAPDTIHRITTTLEAISAYAQLSDGLTLGRLSQDVDPPGFESLASFVSGAPAPKTTQKTKTSSKSTAEAEQKQAKARQLEETRQVKIAAAKLSLQTAKKALVEARTRAQSFESEKKTVYAEAKQAEKHLREAEMRFKKASAAAEAAAERSRTIADESTQASQAVEEARRAVDKATKELESLFSGRDSR